eukprot:785438-Ditylum_brightwellii.AAC.1
MVEVSGVRHHRRASILCGFGDQCASKGDGQESELLPTMLSTLLVLLAHKFQNYEGRTLTC